MGKKKNERQSGAEKKKPDPLTQNAMKTVLQEIRKDFLSLKTSVGQLENRLNFSTKEDDQEGFDSDSDSVLINISSSQEDSVLSLSTSEQTNEVIPPEALEMNSL